MRPPGTCLFTFPLGCSHVLITLLFLTGREGLQTLSPGYVLCLLLSSGACGRVRDGSLLITPSAGTCESEGSLRWCSLLSSLRTVGVGGETGVCFLCKLSDGTLDKGTPVIVGTLNTNPTPSSYRLMH